MSFEKATRNALAKLVTECRQLLTADIRDQLQRTYGLQPDGAALPIVNLQHLDEASIEIARELRVWQDHLATTEPGTEQKRRIAAFDRLAQETAFTTLNRLAALRLCEERGHILECVRRGKESDGFALYEQLSGGALGSRGETYRQFLQRVFDELAQDLGVLFDRRQPQSLVFPGERCLEEVLAHLNDPALRHLWQVDETIGWIYQYYNDPAERKKMRESAAPRNSRELAVRNQFFTPRYVVEFLTDNTLGRIWYEMTKGATSLKDNCRYLLRRPKEVFLNAGEDPPPINIQQEQMPNKSQEELLKEPVYISNRPLKDPREIRLLDPACGSMHFGLYAFDIFEVMYEEVWDIYPDLLADLRGTITDKREFLILVPKLIIEHNLHGIEIDPRCAQIAGLSLWLRAQKTWQRLGLRLVERPRIARSNIVCAEPMPGEKELLREFTARLESQAIGHLVELVFDKMQLAGEAGSLLKIEDEIKSVVAKAKMLWKQGPKYEQAKLFGEIPVKPEQQEFKLDLSGVTDEQFWDKAEEHIYTALHGYSEEAENGSGYQRRLFADDAARGFAFIDLCRKRYDVILMNPPFGEETPATTSYIEAAYPTSKGDLYAAFVDRGVELLTEGSCLGVISSRTGFFAPLRERWRRKTLLRDAPPIVVADLGSGVLDTATVDVAAYVLHKGSSYKHVMFLDARVSEDKAYSLLDGIRRTQAADLSKDTIFFDLALANNLPKAGFFYDSSDEMLHSYISGSSFAERFGETRNGFGTLDDFRFLRLPAESSPLFRNRQWFPTSKGAVSIPFYGDNILLFNWRNRGAELKQFVAAKVGSASRKIQSERYYFLSGLTWGRRTSGPQWFSVLPRGCAFTDNGPIALVAENDMTLALGLASSSIFRAGLRARSSRGGKGSSASKVIETGHVSACPIPSNLDAEASKTISASAVRGISAAMQVAEYTFESSLFLIPWSLHSSYSNDSLAPALKEGVKNSESLVREINLSLEAIDNAILGLGLLGQCSSEDLSRLTPNHIYAGDFAQVREVIDYFFGCIFGRWDIRFAMGEKLAPKLPDPLAPLPICPPGMLQNNEGLPAGQAEVPRNYPLRISWPGILVDDPNHPEDIQRRIREVLAVIWKTRAEAIEHDACEILGAKSLFDYFRKPTGFFADHLKHYSKNHRQAPIYWPLSTVSGNYTVWVYYHRLNDDFLYKVVNDYVSPKLIEVERRLAQVETDLQRATGREATRLREAFEETKSFWAELQDFRAELLRVAELPYKPNLNDGVLIAAAPLWNLFRLPKWRKDLKECWEQLEAEEYDWAHLAYSIWPERVREKCKIDRSLAIAHGLEDLCETSPRAESSGSRKKRKAKAAAPAES